MMDVLNTTRLNRVLLKHYVIELHEHLFGDTEIEELIRQHSNHPDHRIKHYLSLYFIQNKKIFYYYFSRRKKLGLDDIFNQILASLNSIQSTMTADIVGMLDVSDLQYDEVSEYEVKEFRKHLISFCVWSSKKSPNEFMFLKEPINQTKMPPIETMEPYKSVKKLTDMLRKLL